MANQSTKSFSQSQQFDQQLLVELSFVNQRSGVPTHLLSRLEHQLQTESFTQSTIDKLNLLAPDLSVLALEAGFYQVALDLGLPTLFDKGRALLFVGKKDEAGKISDQLCKSTDQILALEGQALKLQMHRMSGNAEAGILAFQDCFIGLPSGQSPRMSGEIFLQIGSAYFQCAQYSLALENYQNSMAIFKAAKLPGKQAIAAFNCGVAAYHLEQKSYGKQMVQTAQDILEKYPLRNLQLSMELFQIERLVGEQKYSLASQAAKLFLAQSDLSMVQRVLAGQALAESLIEIGALLAGEIVAATCRQHMIQNSFYQYETFQLAIEQNIEVLLHRQVVRQRYFNHPACVPDVRAQNKYKVARARKAFVRMDWTGMAQIIKKLPQDVVARASDLLAFEQNLTWSPLARTQEMILLQILFEGARVKLGWFCQQMPLIIQPNIWQQSLLTLGETFLAFLKGDSVVALELATQALLLTESNGLERLSTIALGLIGQLDTDYEQKWLERVQTLDTKDQEFFGRLFLGVFGKNILVSKWILSDAKDKLVSTTTSAESMQADLVIEQGSPVIRFKGKNFDLSRSNVVLHIIQAIAQTKNKGLSKEELVQKVWGYEYHPMIHDSLVYTNIGRVREILPIVCSANTYKFSNEITWCYISQAQEQGSTAAQSIRLQFKKILDFMHSTEQSISRKKVVELLNVSERTALRILTEMSNQKLIRKQGQGRGVIYQ